MGGGDEYWESKEEEENSGNSTSEKITFGDISDEEFRAKFFGHGFILTLFVKFLVAIDTEE